MIRGNERSVREVRVMRCPSSLLPCVVPVLTVWTTIALESLGSQAVNPNTDLAKLLAAVTVEQSTVPSQYGAE